MIIICTVGIFQLKQIAMTEITNERRCRQRAQGRQFIRRDPTGQDPIRRNPTGTDPIRRAEPYKETRGARMTQGPRGRDSPRGSSLLNSKHVRFGCGRSAYRAGIMLMPTAIEYSIKCN